MPYSRILIPPSCHFWHDVGAALLKRCDRVSDDYMPLDSVCILVPTAEHIHLLKQSLITLLGETFILPRIVTLSHWMAGELFTNDLLIPSEGQRWLVLYEALRQQKWLMSLFSVQEKTDFFPLSKLLMDLFDEMTCALLPRMHHSPLEIEERWQNALAHWTPQTRGALSDEVQLVWSLWKGQLDGRDPTASKMARMRRIAHQADAPLIWCNPLEPSLMEHVFLQEYAKKQSVVTILLDWNIPQKQSVLHLTWPEIFNSEHIPEHKQEAENKCSIEQLSICPAYHLEDEATQAAQTVINWLHTGYTRIAIVAQDRIVARRVRALLERAQISVSDETGWKLSTTRAAACVMAWFDVISTHADTLVLLDFLQAPYVLNSWGRKAESILLISTRLREKNVSGGWASITMAMSEDFDICTVLTDIKQYANLFVGNKTALSWAKLNRSVFKDLGIEDGFSSDEAGTEILKLLDQIEHESHALLSSFSFLEWRTWVGVQLENTTFISAKANDKRVVMLPLNGMRLRPFDAVWILGADATHLPSPTQETLFFSDTVRYELGLETRMERQKQQLRDVVEVLRTSGQVILSWQAYKNNEPNRISPWIERLQWSITHHGETPLKSHRVALMQQYVIATELKIAAPSAPQLLPHKISASGYNSLVACPYQFFATRMLGLSELENFSDMPEKRDYGSWLHIILKQYHDVSENYPESEREIVLHRISKKIFDEAISRMPAALGYYSRWLKTVPEYVTWANKRQEQGWRFVLGEQWLEHTLSWPDGSIQLHGRVDRIDQNDEGTYSVLDYKTTAKTTLSKKIKDRDDHQLAFYGLLPHHSVESAHYLAFEGTKGKVSMVDADQYDLWKQKLHAQIQDNMISIQNGATLPAQGTSDVCQYCSVRGLCRKREGFS